MATISKKSLSLYELVTNKKFPGFFNLIFCFCKKIMRSSLVLILIFFSNHSFSQTTDSLPGNKVAVMKDDRIESLARKEAALHNVVLQENARTAQGFRLMVLNTSNKEYAFKVRAQLLQKFPEQKPYMWYANPYIRIKFGNFRTKEEAEPYRKAISQMLGGATIYFIPETIEVNPSKETEP